MKFNKKITYTSVFIALCLGFLYYSAYKSHSNNSRKKILLLTSKGGHGHATCTHKLKELFGATCDVDVINPLESTLKSLDSLRWMTGGKMDGETFHNRMAQSGWIRTLNFFCKKCAPFLFKRNRKKIEQKFFFEFKKKPYDLVVSTIPLINYPASQAAKRLDIPYVLICLDLDLSLWLLDLKKATLDNMHITVPFQTDLTKRQLKEQLIPDGRVHVVGPCLRQSFLEKKNVQVIKKEWRIPSYKKVVMVMMGGAGSRQVYTICKKLFTLQQDIHVLACVGRNTSLIKKIEALPVHSAVSFSVIPFTKKIADLMAASDTLITKPGGLIVSEALALKLPLIFDNTQPMLFWEREAARYVCQLGYGKLMKKRKNLPLLLNSVLHPSAHDQQKKVSFPNFDNEIKKIVKDLLP